MTPLAITRDFLTALAALPARTQHKVHEFLEKFHADSTRSSLHLEPLHAMRDDRVRTARVDQKYRAVLLSPSQGDTYVAVWVDNHDEAMAWAKNKRFEINPTSGAWQVIDIAAAEGAVAELQKAPPDAVSDALFAYIEDADLLRTGLPRLFLPVVRRMRTHADLDEARPYLPEETFEALYYISEGASVAEALTMARITLPETPVDVTDMAAALAHPDSLRRVKVITSDDELKAMLSAPLEQWRVFLHPAQADWVKRNFNGPARVLGGAGTGKTVVAMHRARHLAREIFTHASDQILFLTFSPNLARNISQNLDSLCGPERSRIEVTGLHSWAFHVATQSGRLITTYLESEVTAFWAAAYAHATTDRYPLAFYRTEWANVIRPNAIKTLEEYLQVRRIGQGAALSSAERMVIWPVLEAFRQQMAEGWKVEISEIPFLALEVIRSHRLTFPYRAVVVDEVQDLSPVELQLIRAIVPSGANDLFLVGDGHQRIYNTVPAPLSAWGIKIVGRSRKLYLNYRTTEHIRRWASQVLTGLKVDDLDGEIDTLKGYISLRSGEAPTVKHFRNARDEIQFIVNAIDTLLFEQDVDSQSICVVARNSAQLNRYQRAFIEAQIPLLYLKTKTRDDESEGVRLATMHRVKGLEFNHVFIVGVNEGTIPARQGLENDRQAMVERCLLHVAATRARDRLTITSWGSPSAFLQST